MKSAALSIIFFFISTAAMSQVFNNKLWTDTVGLKQLVFTISPLPTFPENNGQAIPQNYYAQHLGFFCRQELKMQQAHVPLTFRLGSMEYCNWLEQKPGYTFLPAK